MSGRLVHVGLCGVLLLLSARTVSAEVKTWKVDGDTREAIVYAPTAARGRDRAPVIFSFHGRGDTIQSFQDVDLQAAAPGAIVVYLQGLETRGGLSGWQVEAAEYNDRDLKAVDAVLASLRQQYNVDDDRIYATGFSNGAAFTYLLWAERPGVFAAYAAVAGRLGTSTRPQQPRPLFHLAGKRDPQVLFADQMAAVDTAIRVNGVGSSVTSCGEGCSLYGSGTPAPVMLRIHPGGHSYPPSTSAQIASFFREHPRAAR